VDKAARRGNGFQQLKLEQHAIELPAVTMRVEDEILLDAGRVPPHGHHPVTGHVLLRGEFIPVT
jgi:hypothetical protein